MAEDSILVVFDLDDTLIDTTGVLVPEALERVANVLGVETDQLNAKGKKIDEVLEPLGAVTPEQREAAAKEWYSPEVPPLTPLPEALEALDFLRRESEEYVLVLLTRGNPQRQENKIDAAGLRSRFQQIVIRPIEGDGTKEDDLRALIRRYQPKHCWVIGDDENDEIFYGRRLGCWTVRVDQESLVAAVRRVEAHRKSEREGDA